MKISRFERYVAARYLWGVEGKQEGRRFLRFIIVAAIGGVAVGVLSLLLSLSIVRGFSNEIRNKLVGFGAHVQVENMQDEPLDSTRFLVARIDSIPQVRHIAPVIQEFVLLRHTRSEIEGVVLWGTDRLPAYLSHSLTSGRPDLRIDSQGKPGLILGAGLARLLQVKTGDLVTAFSMRGFNPGETASLSRPRIKQFRVQGIYETDLENFDETYVFVNIGQARSFLGYEADEVSRLDLTLTDIEQALPVAVGIEDRIGFPIMARTIFEVWRGLFAWVELQEGIIPLVISFIVLVAAFNIVGALLMIVLEKSREIGVFESMGAPQRVIRRLFIWLGFLVGLIGTAIGEVLAFVLAVVQKRYEIIPLPAEAYYMKTAPVAMNPLDFLVVAVVTIALCVAASYFPARVAARTDPIRVIHFR